MLFNICWQGRGFGMYVQWFGRLRVRVHVRVVWMSRDFVSMTHGEALGSAKLHCQALFLMGMYGSEGAHGAPTEISKLEPST